MIRLKYEFDNIEYVSTIQGDNITGGNENVNFLAKSDIIWGYVPDIEEYYLNRLVVLVENLTILYRTEPETYVKGRVY